MTMTSVCTIIFYFHYVHQRVLFIINSISAYSITRVVSLSGTLFHTHYTTVRYLAHYTLCHCLVPCSIHANHRPVPSSFHIVSLSVTLLLTYCTAVWDLHVPHMFTKKTKKSLLYLENHIDI